MLHSWKAWVLIALFLGPYVVFMGLGFLWLLDHGWVAATVGSLAGISCGVLFYILAARWTKTVRSVLPPIDWNEPRTFAPVDRQAWTLVHEEAERSESIPMDALIGADLYIDTGRKLAATLAKHYHPITENPLDDVPVLELLTALELAAEDLNGLCRQLPGGDLVTPGHWKRVVQMSGYIQKANNLYTYLMPLINPATGLPRLLSQKLMVQPAWKSMQQNVLRWFFQAYVNRLGMHLVELYSGRLVIGAQQYRRLTRLAGGAAIDPGAAAEVLKIAVAGSKESGHDAIVAAILGAKHTPDPLVEARFKATGLTDSLLKRLLAADWVEVRGYTAKPDKETARDRSTRRHSIDDAVECDLLLLVIDDRHGSLTADAAFANDWDRWYVEHPSYERPPLVAAMITTGRERIDAARAVLPPTLNDVVMIDPAHSDPVAVAAACLPGVAAQLSRAERVAVLRGLNRLAGKSKAGRLFKQVGERGKWLLGHIRRPKPGQTESAATTEATGAKVSSSK